ncbi:MAG: hypothetical protein WCX97_01200 [Candidatus Magasanikbacteria bacterium]
MSNQYSSSLFNQLLILARKKRCRIAMSVLRPEPEIIESIRLAQKEVDVLVLGKPVDGVESIAMADETAIGLKMIEMFKKGEINQFVRGQIDDFGLVDNFKKAFNIPVEVRRDTAGLVLDPKGHEFFIAGASNPDSQNYVDKRRVTDGVIWLLDTYFKVKPKVAVMSTCRSGSYGRDPVMSATYEEAEKLVTELTERGIEARNVNIELEQAVAWGANIIVAARGAIGNQIFRTLYYLCGGKILCCPTYFPGQAIYEDDSRNETDYYPHLIAAAAWANYKL